MRCSSRGDVDPFTRFRPPNAAGCGAVVLGRSGRQWLGLDVHGNHEDPDPRPPALGGPAEAMLMGLSAAPTASRAGPRRAPGLKVWSRPIKVELRPVVRFDAPFESRMNDQPPVRFAMQLARRPTPARLGASWEQWRPITSVPPARSIRVGATRGTAKIIIGHRLGCRRDVRRHVGQLVLIQRTRCRTKS